MLSDPTLRSSLQHVSVCVCVFVYETERWSESMSWSLSVLQRSDAAIVGVCFRAS